MEDLTGKRFGKWVVIERAYSQNMSRGAKWLCRCDCGTEKVVWGKYLRNGKSYSCGCSHRREWVGERFGSLVIKNVRNTPNGLEYDCVCDCGNEITVRGSSIYGTHSCGCSRRINCVGEKYGKLTITKMLHNFKGDTSTYVMCDCDCGNTQYITSLNGLRSGNTKSCGCTHSPNLVGRRFGKLTVVRQLRNIKSQKLWLCKCDCGSYISLTSYILNSGHTKSCGCLRSEKHSYMETQVKAFLQKRSIPFISEYTTDDCISDKGLRLRFDFYLPSYNTIIECDGEQHFHPVEFFGGVQAFNNLKRNDLIKDNYCKTNEISLLRLPYTKTESDIELLLSQYINDKSPVTTTA